jgi:hypothetical protein
MERRIFGKLADNDSVDEMEGISHSSSTPTYYMDPVMRTVVGSKSKLPLEQALQELGKRQQIIKFSHEAPRVYFNSLDEKAADAPSAMARTDVNSNNIALYNKVLKDNAKDPEGLAKILMHELTHSLGGASGHALGEPKKNEAPGYFSEFYDPRDQQWGKTTKQAEDIFSELNR